MPVRENLNNILTKIDSICKNVNRDPNEIKIIAVTKYVSIETTKEALNAGIKHLGENRDSSFVEKYSEIGENCTWHFIGSLQTKKVKQVIEKVDYIHSLDRISLAEEINKRANKKVKCFVQVNASGEQSKHGMSPEDVVSFVKELQPYSMIEVVGLMTMAPFTEDKDVIRSTFKKLRKLRDEIISLQIPYAPCLELSMGMSNDYDIAIEEGATFIRIGTSLVGKEF